MARHPYLQWDSKFEGGNLVMRRYRTNSIRPDEVAMLANIFESNFNQRASDIADWIKSTMKGKTAWSVTSGRESSGQFFQEHRFVIEFNSKADAQSFRNKFY